MKKLAVIRSEKTHRCPFGLTVGVGCKNAGDSVTQMTALLDVPEERGELQKQHNIAVYSMSGSGRCKYADQLLPNNVTNCDFGDAGAGIHDTALPTNPGYPRVWGGVGLSGYYSFPLSDYWDNPESARVFNHVYAAYAEDGSIRFNKTAWFCRPDAELLKVIELCEFRSAK